MGKIPTSINTQFNALLNTNNIPKRYQNHYLKRLRYYLDFCHKYGFSKSNPQSLPNFVRKLKEKRQTDAQQKQANQAIYIFYELILS
jgi:predicted phosphoadenosine phosphosulfate sulfurtransferase